jgi:hypothetical protein
MGKWINSSIVEPDGAEAHSISKKNSSIKVVINCI